MEHLISAPSNRLNELCFQRKLISDAISDIEEKHGACQPWENELNSLRSLVQFAKFHFACEEKLLLSHDHPSVEEHVATNQRAFMMIDAILQGIERGKEVDGRLCQSILDIISRQLSSEYSITFKLYGAQGQH